MARIYGLYPRLTRCNQPYYLFCGAERVGLILKMALMICPTALYPDDMSKSRIYTAALIVIGDEILSGRTADKNIPQISKWLNVQGIRLAEVRVVADNMDAIAEAVNILRSEEHTSELQSRENLVC